MALRVAVASGNWSNPAIWNGGVLPSPGDVVASNTYTVTIDQNINVGTLTNTAQSIVDAVPDMTSYTTPSGVVTASSEVSGFPAWQAFGAGSSLEWRYNNSAWIEYQFPTPKVIDQYYFTGDTTNPSWTFEAWDGSTWVVLHSGTNASTYTSPLLGNSTLYIKYRLNITNTTTNRRIREIDFYEYLGTSSATAGGGFVFGGGVTITLTGASAITYSSAVLTWNGGSGTTANIVANIINGGSGAGIVLSGTGTINIVANRIIGNTGTASTSAIHINANATVNITAELMDSPNTGAGSDRGCVRINSNSTLNITGNLVVNGTATDCAILSVPIPTTINITGNITSASLSPGTQSTTVINSIVAYYLKHIGSITVTGQRAAIINTSTSATHLFTGPFICSTYGFVPLQVVRMHLIPTTSSYFEFRDETTNGALSPAPTAPATQLVSPATLISNLATSDVRFGIVYALGTLTGTLRMPTANQVTFGVAVDNTFGASVLTAASIWDYLVSNITTADSIGMRLKNVSTPQTTGEQLEAFLRLD